MCVLQLYIQLYVRPPTVHTTVCASSNCTYNCMCVLQLYIQLYVRPPTVHTTVCASSNCTYNCMCVLRQKSILRQCDAAWWQAWIKALTCSRELAVKGERFDFVNSLNLRSKTRLHNETNVSILTYDSNSKTNTSLVVYISEKLFLKGNMTCLLLDFAAMSSDSSTLKHTVLFLT